VKESTKSFTVRKVMDGVAAKSDSASSQMIEAAASAKNNGRRDIPFAIHFMSLLGALYSISLP
jgi:hypothetical protein